jgi:hypothetical protein
MTGLTAGLLSVICRQQKQNNKQNKNHKPVPSVFDITPQPPEEECTLEQTQLYGKVRTISSISGGSWFAAKLIYSSQFLDMVESVATNTASSSSSDADADGDEDENENAQTQARQLLLLHSAIATQYNVAFSDPFISLGQNAAKAEGADFLNAVLVSSQLPEEYRQTLLLLNALRGRGGRDGQHTQVVSWLDAMELVLADIPKNATLGGDSDITSLVQPWAEGKNWAIIVSVVTPVGDGDVDDDDDDDDELQDEHSANSIWYHKLSEQDSKGNTKTNRLSYTTSLSHYLEQDKDIDTDFEEQDPSVIAIEKVGSEDEDEDEDIDTTYDTIVEEDDPSSSESLFRPARFSVVLGAPPATTPAPFPYSSDIWLERLAIDYRGQHWCQHWCSTWLCSLLYEDEHEQPMPMVVLKESSLTDMTATTDTYNSFSDTPIHGAVGASSAAFGALSLMDWSAYLFQDLFKV